jgi:serine/threonine protein kinase
MVHLTIEKVIHKDLAARNILVSETGKAKVSDFGLSRLLGNDSNERMQIYISQNDQGPLKWFLLPLFFFSFPPLSKLRVFFFGQQDGS